jgi:dienelactone hydrolase
MARVQRIVRELGEDRFVGVAGFSLGGLMSLNLAQSLGRGSQLPVWLFDTYSPRMGLEHFWRKVERNIAWRVWGGRPPKRRTLDELAEHIVPGIVEVRAPDSAWTALKAELGRSPCAAPKVSVHLIQATHTVNRAAYVFRRATNGFRPSAYASWQRTSLPADHAELTSRLSDVVAGVVAGALTATV